MESMQITITNTKTHPCNIQIFFFFFFFFFFGRQNENFHWKKFDIFLIFAKNRDFGFTLEPPPLIPQSFYSIKVGFKVVYISRTCFPDE